MRVLVSRISPDTVGGAELSALDYVTVLKELGHTPILATNLKTLRKKANAAGIDTLWFPWINRGPSSFTLLRHIFFISMLPFTWVWALLLAIWSQADLINPHSREDQIAFTLTRFIHRKPVVWKDPGDFRMHLDESFANSAVKRIYRRLLVFAIRHANHIYSMNPEHVEFVIEQAGELMRPKLSQIPSGILFRNLDRNAKAVEKPEGKTVIGTVVRLDKFKGADLFVGAAKELGSQGNLEFWFVNDQGIDRDEIMKMAKGCDYIKFFPHTDNVSSYYKAFDILAHASDSEGWGRVIREAMYFGLPIVATNIDGVRLHIVDEKNGLLFERRDQAMLVKQLKRLLDDPKLREKLGRAAKKKAETEGDFTKTMKEQILPLFESFTKPDGVTGQ